MNSVMKNFWSLTYEDWFAETRSQRFDFLEGRTVPLYCSRVHVLFSCEYYFKFCMYMGQNYICFSHVNVILDTGCMCMCVKITCTCTDSCLGYHRGQVEMHHPLSM